MGVWGVNLNVVGWILVLIFVMVIVLMVKNVLWVFCKRDEFVRLCMNERFKYIYL